MQEKICNVKVCCDIKDCGDPEGDVFNNLYEAESAGWYVSLKYDLCPVHKRIAIETYVNNNFDKLKERE